MVASLWNLDNFRRYTHRTVTPARYVLTRSSSTSPMPTFSSSTTPIHSTNSPHRSTTMKPQYAIFHLQLPFRTSVIAISISACRSISRPSGPGCLPIRLGGPVSTCTWPWIGQTYNNKSRIDPHACVLADTIFSHRLYASKKKIVHRAWLFVYLSQGSLDHRYRNWPAWCWVESDSRPGLDLMDWAKCTGCTKTLDESYFSSAAFH